MLLSRFLGCFREFLLNIDGVAGNVLAALTEEEPDKNKDRAAKSKEAVFDGVGPVGGEKDNGVNDAEADGIEVATGEDDFLGKRKITSGKGILSTVIGMTKEFAVEDKFERTADDGVIEDDNEPHNPVDTKGAEKNLAGGKQNIRNYIKLGGIFAVFWCLILRERPFASASAVESISQLSGEKNNKGLFWRATSEADCD